MAEREQQDQLGPEREFFVDRIVTFLEAFDGLHEITGETHEEVEDDQMILGVLQGLCEDKSRKLAQQTAKVKELRELLQSIEWHTGHFGEIYCVVCDGGAPGPYGKKTGPEEHRPDCKLKAEIDQLEPGEEREEATGCVVILNDGTVCSSTIMGM